MIARVPRKPVYPVGLAAFGAPVRTSTLAGEDFSVLIRRRRIRVARGTIRVLS